MTIRLGVTRGDTIDGRSLLSFDITLVGTSPTTVLELLKLLSTFPPDARVVLPEIEGDGFNEVQSWYAQSIKAREPVVLSRSKYRGPELYDEVNFVPDEVAVVLGSEPQGEPRKTLL